MFSYKNIPNKDSRKRVKKTEDNLAVIENANEQAKLISCKYLPKVKKWLQDIAKISSNVLKLYLNKRTIYELILDHIALLNANCSNRRIFWFIINYVIYF